ncbi:MAG: aldose 1-epimerase family protein, partial [Bacteroidia bacterium]|nr:aldose 1-epimerase family protein [Bacteroidia bacterium]
DHEYIYGGKTYKLSHHGFARDNDFELLHQSEHSASFVLQPNEEILEHYPFEFTLLITFELDQKSLKQTFRVINSEDKSIPVSFGGHPAFNIHSVSEYKIIFEHEEYVQSNQLEGPYINDNTFPIIKGNEIQLTETIFDNDALIFQNLKSGTVELKHTKSKHSIKVNIEDFPYLGIWAKPNAPFVCIEPWQGMADLVNHNKKIEDKKGIVWVAPNDEISKSFTMHFTN